MISDLPEEVIQPARVLLAELSTKDIRLWADNSSLRYDAPTGVFDDELKAKVRRHKAALLAILRAEVETQAAPLSCQQERMWFLSRLDRSPGLYVECLVYRLAGPLDEAILEKALAWVLQRHAVLRGVFRDGRSGPEQAVILPATADLQRTDLSALAPTERDRALDRALARFRRERLDLGQGPVIRFSLLRLGPEESILALAGHHAVVDGWSGGLIMADLARAYNAFGAGTAPTTPPPAATYAAFARQQQAQIADGSLDREAATWARELEGLQFTPSLPSDLPRPPAQAGQGAELDLALAPDTLAGLTRFARAQGGTAFAALLAALGVVLARASGQRRLLVGAPTSGRTSPEWEDVVGYFSNTVPVLLDFRGVTDFAGAVSMARDGVLASLSREHIPLERLIQAVRPSRSPAYSPLFQTLFSLQPKAMIPPALAGLEVTRLPSPPEPARYDLTLLLTPTLAGGLEGLLVYDVSLFLPATIQAWRRQFLEIVEQAARGQAAALYLPEAPSIRPGPAAAKSPAPYQPPAGPWEARLAQIWAEFLDARRIGRQDDFFLLGGHSLLLMRLVNRINAVGLGNPELADLMSDSTLAGMAAVLEGRLAPMPESAAAAPPTCAETASEFPASPGQEGLWLERRDLAASVIYSVPFVLELAAGQAEPELVTQALATLIQRHAAMRTVLVEREGGLRQRVLPSAQPDLTIHDLRQDADPTLTLQKLAQRELGQPFDLQTGPLFRFHLLRLPTGGGLLCGVADHVVFDGWSLEVMRQELNQILTSLVQGQPPALPPLPMSYAEAMEAARSDLAGARGQALEGFWQKRLQGLELGPLPQDGPVGSGPTQGRRLVVELGPEVGQALDQLAVNQRCTPSTVWIATVAGLLSRYKDGQGPVAVGAPFAGRRDPRSQGLIGYFVNLLPVILPVDWSQPFGQLQKAARTEVMAVMDHQDTPLPWLTARATDLGLPAGAPLIDAVAVFLDQESQELDLSDADRGAGKFPLMLTISRRVQGDCLLVLEYDQARYSRARMERLPRHLEHLLLAAARQPETPLGELDLLPPDERQQVVEEFNHTTRDYPGQTSLAALFRDSAARHPQRPALAWRGGTMTYAELDRLSDRLAAGLALAGARPGEVVGLALERGPQAITAILGLAKAGCAYLPLDPGFPPELVAGLLADCQATRVVADHAGRERLAGLDLGPGWLDLAALPLDAPPPVDPPGGEALAYVMFTSGTTGQPKSVMVPQRAVARLAINADFLRLTPDDGMAQAAPLGFDAATLEIWSPLLNGARVCLLADEDLMDPKVLAGRLTSLGVSALWLTASLLNRLVEEDPTCLRSLRVLLAGGEALSPSHLRRLRAACPELAIINGYGPTENTTFTTTHRLEPADLAAEAIPIGRPIANTRAYVLDRQGNHAPIGVWGELHAAGDGLALGYAGRPDLTQAAFVSQAWLPGQRLYRTGDLACWREDGVLLFGGRRDGQVKVRGHRVETGAVETALRALPGVADVVVLALGQGAERLLAAAVAAPRDEQAAWRAALGRTLPDFMIPERFLVLPQLPMTPSGKADRRALAAMLAQASPGGAGRRQPTTAGQLQLAEFWAQLFPGADLDLDSDFFALGGHSLMAMRLAGLIERHTGQRPAVRALLSARRLEAMAVLLESAPTRTAENAGQEIPVAPGPDYPLSSGQARLWMLARLHPDSAAYNVPLALDLAGELNPEALQTALIALEERQHALRLRVVSAPDDPAGVRLCLVPPGSLVLERIDCASEPDPEAKVADLVEAQVMRPFRLESESPGRAFLYQLGPDRWRLLLILHHAVCDAWSLPLIWRDLGAFYTRALGLPGTDLPPLVRHYEDFAAWQRDYLTSPAGRMLLERWKERLTPLPEPLALPLDRPRPPVRGFRGGYVEMRFSPETSKAVWALAAKQGATPFALLLALLQVLLWRHTGQTDLALGSLVAGRDRAVLADLVGFFVNTLVLRQRIDPSASLRDHLTSSLTTLLEAIVDQDCPFEALVEAAGAPRDTSRNPLFEVLAVWQDGNISTLELPGLRVTPVDAPFPFAKFDLGFYFVHQGDAIGVQVEFDRDLFDRASVESMLEHFKHLLDQALDDPDQPLSALEVMDPAERELVIDGFNATELDLFSERTIPEPCLTQCAATPEAAAVHWGEETLSYQAFVARAAGVAARLQANGVKPGQVVALCARRSPEMLIGIHGILLAGGAYAPLDPDHPESRRADMLEDLGDPLILASEETVGLFAGRRVLTLSGAETAPPAPPSSRPRDLAYVIFTSGSTGRPKGAMIEHRSALNRILWMQETFPLGPGDVILQKTPITFDVSVWELFWWSWVGAAVVLPPPGAERDPKALVEAVARHRVTVMHFVPSMLAEFLAYLESGREDPVRLASLRYVFASGEALDAGLVERFNRLLHAPLGVELHNLYGPTEAAVDVSWQPCSPWTSGSVVPIGRPIANTRLYVLDPDLNPAPVGVAGEVCIGGVQVGRGYVNRPELTAERFLPDPFVPGGRIYRTGDLGRWRRDGVIEYLGRSDHQVKVRGHRIELAEIEHALEAHPGVERAVVTPVQAHGLVELHAYLLGAAELTSAGLRQHLRQSLPEYMVPARFLRLERLPLTSSGKVDRKALNGSPLEPTVTRVESLAPFEAEVLALWRAVLPEAELDAHSGFFESGGNSLLLIRLHERLEARWPGVFSVAELFGRPTVADQAALLAGSLPAPAPTAEAQAQAGPVAIVGLAVRLAGAEDLASFWRDLAAGVDRVRPLPLSRTAEARSLLAALGHSAPKAWREAAYLDDIYGFDPRRLRLSPMDAALLDPEQRLFLETAVGALENAGYGGQALDGAKVGVFAGATPLPHYREVMGRLHPERAEQIFALNVPSNLATRLSFLHDWRGPAALVDTACSSGLAAVHLACRALATGECQAALVGSANVLIMPPDAETRLTIDSSTARTRAFAAGADGTGMGEGAVALLLKPLSAALADGDAIHAVILGSAVNQDGASSGMAAPNPAAQAEVIAAAAHAAGVGLETVSYLEAHGTGTALGDPIEIDGLTRAFAAAKAEKGFAAIGAVKGNYGHLDAAAGALGLAKAVLCLAHDAAPPQPFFDAPNPRIDFQHAPVHVPTHLEPLADRGVPRRAGVSSFGLSGINAHVLLEAAPIATAKPELAGGWLVAGISAGSEADLRLYAARLAEVLRQEPAITPAQVAHVLASGRDRLPWRAALVVSQRDELLSGLDLLARDGGAVSQALSASPGNKPASSPAWSAALTTAETAAQTFLAGGDLAWPEGLKPRRVHLPATPFTRQTCRPDFSHQVKDAPLLGRRVATPQGPAWPLPLADPDFWPVAEHLLEGSPTLVGMALPGLLAAAAQDLGLSGNLTIRELAWLRPLRPQAIAPGSASLVLTRQAEGPGYSAILGGLTPAGEWTLFARAQVGPEDQAPSQADFAAARERCSREVALPAFSPDSGPIQVSRRWDCRLQAWQSADGQEALVLLGLPEEFSADRQRHPLHPALLDVAASLALDRPGRLPAGCREMRLLAPLPERVLVHVQRRTANARELLADLTLHDPASGAMLMSMTGLRFVSPAGLAPAMSRLAWRPAPLPPGAACPGPLLVVGEGDLAQALAAHLAETGLLAGQSPSAAPDPAFLAELLAGRSAGLVLAPSGGEDLAWRAAAVLRSVLARLERQVRVLVVGHGAYALDQTDPSSGPEAGLLAGLTLAVAQEEPLLALRYLDLDPATAPDLALSEFVVFDQPDGSPIPAAIWRGGQRFVPTLEPLPATTGPLAWPEQGCCLVTGGLGAFALTLAQEFSHDGRLPLALLSRRGDVDDADPESAFQRQRLSDLAQAGVTVHTYACDVSDRTALSATLHQVRAELGPISAVVHTAGLADGAFLLRQEKDDFQAILAAKAQGARLLDELTREDPLQAFVLFGSLTGLGGAPGQAAYAAANAYLASLAHWRRSQGRPALCLDWCALEGVGMAARSERFRGQGLNLDADGARAAWRAALVSGLERVTLLPPLTTDTTPSRTVTAPVSSPTAPPSAIPPSATMEGDLEGKLAGIWAQVLGYERVGLEDNFFSLGGDSITGMQIVNRVVNELGLPVSLAQLFEQPTPASLAQALRQAPAAIAPAAVSPAPLAEDYPVAWEQVAVLRAEAAGEMGTAFNLPALVELPSDFEPERLRTAIDQLVERHEILRTVFSRAGDDFRMRVLSPGSVDLPARDLPAGADLWAACRALVRPFDPFTAPPVRWELLHLADGRRALFFDLHHSLADGLSQELLLADLATLYAGQAKPAPSLQFKDYAWWSRSGAGSDRLEADLAWWRERFAGPLPLTDLPADHPRPPRHTWRGDTISFVLEPGLLAALRTRAAAQKVTTFALVLAAWAALVHRLTHGEDVVIAAPVDARDVAGLSDLPGMLVSLLPLRLAVSGGQSVASLIRQAQDVHTEALGHRAANLALLLADLAPPAAPERTLLSEITLSYMNFAEAAPSTGASEGFHQLGLTRDSCKNDLGIFIRDLPDRMLVSLEYYADLFDRPRMERLGRQFQTLLADLARGDAEKNIAALPLLGSDEERTLLAWGQGSTPELPLTAGIFPLFNAQVERAPQAIAVEEAGRAVTYDQLREQALALAGGLLRAGVAPGDRVALHLRRGPEVIAALLSILAVGAAYVPLDPAYPPERNRFILEDAQCRLVLVDSSGRESLGQGPPCSVQDLAQLLAQSPAAMADLPPADGARPAYLMYTSGSTGQPKGVLVSQPAVIRLALGADYAGLSPEDHLLQTGPLAFDASTFEIWGALLNGARVCVAQWEDLIDPARLAGIIAQFKTSVIWLTAGLFNRQVEYDPGTFQKVRVVITGGEALSPAHARRALTACPGVCFLNGYGPTENTTFSLVHHLTPEGLEVCPAAIGRPIAHSEALVLDPAGGLSPAGVWGEICVGGPGLAEGYWRRPELTAERFMAHPWQPGQRLYRTGDRGRWRDGILEFGGRQDGQVKLRGLRIELEEIERTLADHPAVGRAVVLLNNPAAGEPEIVAALIPAAEGTSFDQSALRRWLGRRLPAYMLPSRFIAVEDIPVTANGKVDHPALLARLDQTAQPGVDQDHAPQGEFENLVAEVFSQVFGRPMTDRRAGFLELGGHSLLAIKAVNRLAEHTGVRLAMRDFYASPSLADLARLLEAARKPAASGIPPAPPAEAYPTSHSQQRLYLLHQLEGGSGAYNMTFAFRCDGGLDVSALSQALFRLCERHEPLRTGFEERAGEIMQRVAPIARPVVVEDDLRERADAWDETLRLARRETSAPFDLARPPLLRARVLRVGSDESLLLLVLHHIVGDGWSSRILVRELGALYAEACGGPAANLSPLPLTYKDYALWQRGQRWSGAAEFWRDRLAGAPPRVDLPTDHPLPETQSYRGATCYLELPPGVLAGLKAMARSRGATVAAAGLAVFAALLYRLTRQGDLLLGMGVAGRERAGLEGLIGFFVNVLPIRLILDDDTELESLVDQARDAVFQALDQRDYPFDLLVRDLAPTRQGNRQPLINVVFEYQNFGQLGQDGPGLPLRQDHADQIQSRLATLVESQTAKHDLLVFLLDDGGQGQLQIEYDTDILDPATVQAWLGYLAQFLASAARLAPPGPETGADKETCA